MSQLQLFHESEAYRKGDVSQRLCGEWLTRNGWLVIYLCDSAGSGAPMAHGQGRRVVLPDFDIARRGARRFVEVKYKRTAQWYRKRKRLQHGLERRLFNAYLQIEEDYKTEVWLAIHEGITDKLIARRVCDLLPHAQTWDGRHPEKADYGDMIFFPRREFEHLATIPIARPESGISEIRQAYAAGHVNFRAEVGGDLALDVADCVSDNTRAYLFRHKHDAITLRYGNDLLPWLKAAVS